MADDRPGDRRLFLILALVAIGLGCLAIILNFVFTVWQGPITYWTVHSAAPTARSGLQRLSAIYAQLTDWHLQLAAVAALFAALFLVLFGIQTLRLRSANKRLTGLQPAADAAIQRAEAHSGEAIRDAELRVTNAVDELDEVNKRVELQERQIGRLTWLRTQMIALDESTISEMVVAEASPEKKRAEAISRILYALLRVIRHSIPDSGARDSFIECIVDGQARGIPFPPSENPQQRARYEYGLHVLKDFELTAAEKYEIEHIPRNVGLVNRAISTGKPAYLPDVNAPDAVELGYWRPDHDVPYRSMLCVPACAMQKVVGVLCADSGKVDGFDEWERGVVQSFATKVAVLYAALPNPNLWD
jgi:hypothetical protein